MTNGLEKAKKLTKAERASCPPCFCLRADGITCPDDECDYESGIYQGPVERWWLLGPTPLDRKSLDTVGGEP